MQLALIITVPCDLFSEGGGVVASTFSTVADFCEQTLLSPPRHWLLTLFRRRETAPQSTLKRTCGRSSVGGLRRLGRPREHEPTVPPRGPVTGPSYRCRSIVLSVLVCIEEKAPGCTHSMVRLVLSHAPPSPHAREEHRGARSSPPVVCAGHVQPRKIHLRADGLASDSSPLSSTALMRRSGAVLL